MRGVADGDLEDPAILPHHVVQFEDFGAVHDLPRARMPDGEPAVRRHPHERPQSVTDPGRRHERRVAGDRAVGFEPFDALADGRRAQRHTSAEFTQGDTPFLLEEFEQSSVDHVQ